MQTEYSVNNENQYDTHHRFPQKNSHCFINNKHIKTINRKIRESSNMKASLKTKFKDLDLTKIICKHIELTTDCYCPKNGAHLSSKGYFKLANEVFKLRKFIKK